MKRHFESQVINQHQIKPRISLLCNQIRIQLHAQLLQLAIWMTVQQIEQYSKLTKRYLDRRKDPTKANA
jgi:hypothetical protein